MPGERRENLIEHVRRVASALAFADATDEQLLRLFQRERDQAAFTALVNRHGRMVLGVCRRVLEDSHDAEEAFQATFLVLARKARSVTKPAMLFNWLYSVAQRTAQAAKARRARRRVVEREAARDAAVSPPDDLIWAEVRHVLDDEIGKLPNKYRLPFVLCQLEGKTNEQAAKALGCPIGTVQSRLSRAKERLRLKLTRRGVGLTAGAMATLLSERIASAKAPSALVATTIKLVFTAATGKVTPALATAEVAVIAQKVVTAMWWNKFRAIAVFCLLLGGLCTATGTWAMRESEGVPSDGSFLAQAQQTPPPAKKQGGAKGEAAQGEKAPSDEEWIQGTWIIDSVTRDGIKLLPNELRNLLFGGANPGGTAGFNPNEQGGVLLEKLGEQAALDYPFKLIVTDEEIIFTPDGPAEFKTFILPKGNAEAVANNLRAIYKESPTLSINATSGNSILVYARRQVMADISQLLLNDFNALPPTKAGPTRLQVAKYRIDSTKNPALLDLNWNIEQGKGKVAASPPDTPAIYRLEGDKLAIVFAKKGSPTRPSQFASEANSANHEMWLFHREPAAKAQSGPDGDAKRIQGNWTIVRTITADSQPSDPAIMKITANKISVLGNENAFRCIYEIDPNHEPGWIDVQDIRTPGSPTDRQSSGSYILDGDRLTIVLRGSNLRATNFVTEGNRYFFYLKRLNDPLDELLGEWQLWNAMEAGTPLTKDSAIYPATMTVTRERLTVKTSDKTLLDATYRADPFKRPRWIDLMDVSNNHGTMKGLYYVNEDASQLSLVLDRSGLRGRPSNFTSELGTANDVFWQFHRPNANAVGGPGMPGVQQFPGGQAPKANLGGGKKGNAAGKKGGVFGGGVDPFGPFGPMGAGKGKAAKGPKGPVAPDASVEAIVTSLEDTSAATRAEAIAELHKLSARVERIGGKRTKSGDEHPPKVAGLAPHLAKAAVDPAEANRVAALYALADAMDLEAIPALRDRLGDPSKKVRLIAACLLTEFQDASGLAELKKTLQAAHGNMAAVPLADVELMLLALERVTGKSFGEIPAVPTDGPVGEGVAARYRRLVDTWTTWWDWVPATK